MCRAFLLSRQPNGFWVSPPAPPGPPEPTPVRAMTVRVVSVRPVAGVGLVSAACSDGQIHERFNMIRQVNDHDARFETQAQGQHQPGLAMQQFGPPAGRHDWG